MGSRPDFAQRSRRQFLKRFSRDPDDDKFIHAAVAGRADVLISGDSNLLELGVVRGVPILPPAHVLNLLARSPSP